MATYTGVAYPRQRSRTRNQRRRKLFARQKLMGAVLLLITIGVSGWHPQAQRLRTKTVQQL